MVLLTSRMLLSLTEGLIQSKPYVIFVVHHPSKIRLLRAPIKENVIEWSSFYILPPVYALFFINTILLTYKMKRLI